MTKPNFSRVYDIFRGAIRVATDLREDFLATACSNDGVRAEVEALLEWHDTQTRSSDEAVGAVVNQALGAMVPERIGDFRIEGVLGAGGMGVVYRAVQEQPHRAVALKVLHHTRTDALNQRFRQESEALGRLRHRGIAQIYSAGTTEGDSGPLSYFVMELVDGPDLLSYRVASALSTEDTLRLCVEICDAAHYAHTEGVIHRDLKPGNILVDRDGVPRILDFGVARIADEDAATMTEDGAVIGTVAYMSPEQATGRSKDIGPWSDVYSIGVILYEMLAGRRPIELKGVSVPEALALVENAEPVPLERLEARYAGDLAVIVGKALAKEPEHRYRSADELAADIRRFLDHEPIVARPPSTFYHISRFVRRHRLAVAMAAILAVGAPVITGLGAFVWARLPDLREHERTLAERRLQDGLETAFHDFHEKRTEDAAARFARILEEFPDSKEAFAGETFAQYYLKNYDRVLALIENAEGRFESMGTLQKIRADVLASTGRKEDAEAIIAKAGEAKDAADWFIEGYRHIVQARLAGKLTAAGQDAYREAEDDLMRSIAASSAPRRASYFALAEAIGNQLEPRTSLDFHKILVSRWPDNDRAWWWAGFVATRARGDAAIEYYQEFLRRQPGDFEAHNNMGNALRNLGRDDEAEEQYRAAIKLRPGSLQPLFNLARIAEARDETEKASKIYQAITKAYPEDARSYSEFAGTLHKLGRLEEAHSAVLRAIELDPKLIGSQRNHAIIANSLEKYDEALLAVREAIALDPGSAPTHSIHADVLRAAGRPDEALFALELSIRINPNQAMQQSNLAAEYLKKRRFKEAEKAARYSIKVDPNRSATYLNLGAALSNQGRTAEALEAFRRCIELKPDHVLGQKEFKNHRGALRAAAGKPEIEVADPVTPEVIRGLMKRAFTAERAGTHGTAAEIYCRVTQLDPKNLLAYEKLGEKLMTMSLLEEALAAHDAALAIDANDLGNGYMRGSVLSRMRRYEEAEVAYREVIRRHPRHPESHCNLASILQGTLRFEDALAMYRRGHELGTARGNWRFNTPAWVERAALLCVDQLVKDGKPERAREILDDTIKAFPRRKKLLQRRQALGDA